MNPFAERLLSFFSLLCLRVRVQMKAKGAQNCVARVSAKRAPGNSGPITHLPRMRPQALSGLRKSELPVL